MWKQAVGSTIHCLAGDATGIIVAATITALIGFPMGVDLVVEYVAGFAFGLLIFQALFMKDMMGGSYLQARRRSFLPEWRSTNMVMAGMIPTMVALMMGRDMRAMHPSHLVYWGAMAAGVIVVFVTAYSVKWWLVAKGLEHGMGTQRALGKGGHGMDAEAPSRRDGGDGALPQPAPQTSTERPTEERHSDGIARARRGRSPGRHGRHGPRRHGAGHDERGVRRNAAAVGRGHALDSARARRRRLVVGGARQSHDSLPGSGKRGDAAGDDHDARPPGRSDARHGRGRSGGGALRRPARRAAASR